MWNWLLSPRWTLLDATAVWVFPEATAVSSHSEEARMLLEATATRVLAEVHGHNG